MPVPAPPVPTCDVYSPEAADDPVAMLRGIRAESPVSWMPDLNSYLLTRHADIVAALREPRFISGNLTQGLDRLSPAEVAELSPMRESLERWMGHTNDVDHVRFQQLLKRYFTPAMVNGLRPRVRELTTELLDAVAPLGRMDVVADLAYPLPANVIAEMLGMPTSHREQLQAWSRDITAVFTIADVDNLRAGQRSILEMEEYLRPILADRRAEPRDDLLSMFAAAESRGAVSEAEAVANCVLLLFAGHETTANLIANGLVLLLENPDQLALLRERPDLVPSAVEEMLRLEGPASVISRVAEEEVEVAGHRFQPGERVYLAMNAGNRDPEVFPDPDRFDVTRKPNRHTAFGMGSFYCLGAALARVEADECFRLLLDRLPDLRAGYDRVPWRNVVPLNRRLDTLPVEF
ncbi:cytochrome P450 [Umezawaea sp.]|uniref:cytochrome P450 n=1 Tax=Umezawaea sp. TaxID=1955258 RepID=UPI002ED374E2